MMGNFVFFENERFLPKTCLGMDYLLFISTCFLGSVGNFEDDVWKLKDVYSQKLRDKKALNYIYICHIFKLKSLDSMLKYTVKMFFYYSSFDPW